MRLHKLYFYVLCGIAFSALAGCDGCTKPYQGAGKYIPHTPARTPKERQRFFEKLGVQYIKKIKFPKACAHLAVLGPEAYSNYQSDKQKYDALSDRYGALIAQGYVAKVAIKYISPEVGHGLFACQKFKKGDFVIEYTGELRKNGGDSTYAWSYPPGHNVTLQGKKYSLDAKSCGNEARFANHSDDNNLDMKFVLQKGDEGVTGHIIYVANRDIDEGEELLAHYGAGYWSNRKKLKR